MEEKLTPYQQWKKNLGTTRPWDMLNPKTEYVEKKEIPSEVKTRYTKL